MKAMGRMCRAGIPGAVLLMSLLWLSGAAGINRENSGRSTVEARDTFDDVLGELDLTGEQTAAVNRIKAEHVQRMIEIKRQIAVKYEAIAREILNDEKDKKPVNKLQVEIEDLEIRYMDERLSLLKDIKGFLAERQLLKLDALNRQKQERSGKKMMR